MYFQWHSGGLQTSRYYPRTRAGVFMCPMLVLRPPLGASRSRGSMVETPSKSELAGVSRPGSCQRAAQTRQDAVPVFFSGQCRHEQARALHNVQWCGHKWMQRPLLSKTQHCYTTGMPHSFSSFQEGTPTVTFSLSSKASKHPSPVFQNPFNSLP